MRANVFIDGFNLYYGALKGTPYKWLDLEALSRRMISGHEINRIRYFTARVSARPNNPDAPRRQATYLRALATNPLVTVHYGYFKQGVARMLIAQPRPGWPHTVEVVRTEEKGTDVNIATYLLLDAFDGDCDMSVVISNDADLALPLRVLTVRWGIRVGILNPFRSPCQQILAISPLFYKPIKERALRVSQLPALMADEVGAITRPEKW